MFGSLEKHTVDQVHKKAAQENARERAERLWGRENVASNAKQKRKGRWNEKILQHN